MSLQIEQCLNFRIQNVLLICLFLYYCFINNVIPILFGLVNTTYNLIICANNVYIWFELYYIFFWDTFHFQLCWKKSWNKITYMTKLGSLSLDNFTHLIHIYSLYRKIYTSWANLIMTHSKIRTSRGLTNVRVRLYKRYSLLYSLSWEIRLCLVTYVSSWHLLKSYTTVLNSMPE